MTSKKVLLWLFILLVVQVAFASQMYVVGEVFTENGCPYCPDARSGLSQLAQEQDYVIPIMWQHNGSFASPNVSQRESFYSVGGFPTAMFGGYLESVGGGSDMYPTYHSKYNQIVSQESPLEITTGMDFAGRELVVSADITVTGDITTANNKIVYLLTQRIDDDHFCVVRSYDFEDFTLTNVGDTQHYEHNVTYDSSWDIADLRGIVLVQTWDDDPSANKHKILQAGMASYPLNAPNPIANFDMPINNVRTFDLTDYFYYNGAPVDANITVQSSDTSILEASLEGNTLSLTSSDNTGSVQISVNGEYNNHTAPTSFSVYVTDPSQRNILIFDLDPTPTGETLKASIEEFYTTGEVIVTDDINAYPLSTADAVFVLLGIYSNNHQLSGEEAAPLATYLDNGGKLYMEGGDTWAYDGATPVHPYFKINGTADGTGDLSEVTGLDFLDGMSWSYSGENSYIDHLEPLGDATAVFSTPGSNYTCGIAYDSGTYKTVGTSFEITGLGGTNSLDDAVQAILTYFDVIGGPPMGTLSGSVTDDDNNPVASAIIIAGENMATTDDNGNYSISLTPGTYNVTVTASGYSEAIEENIEIVANEVTVLNFVLTQLDTDDTDVSNVTKLYNNYPNPFNPTTTIAFSLKSASNTEISIYNIKGEKVTSLLNDKLSAGKHSVVWNGKDSHNKQVSSGVYFYKLKTDKFTDMKKMIMMK